MQKSNYESCLILILADVIKEVFLTSNLFLQNPEQKWATYNRLTVWSRISFSTAAKSSGMMSCSCDARRARAVLNHATRSSLRVAIRRRLRRTSCSRSARAVDLRSA